MGALTLGPEGCTAPWSSSCWALGSHAPTALSPWLKWGAWKGEPNPAGVSGPEPPPGSPEAGAVGQPPTRTAAGTTGAARGQGDLGGGPGRGTRAASSCVVGAPALLTTGIFLQNTKSMHLHCVFHGRWETSILGKRQTLESHPGQETGACSSFLITDKGPWARGPHSTKARGHVDPTPKCE